MKKAQFYFLGGIILITSLFFVVANSSKITVRDQVNTQLYLDNYLTESKIIMNNALYYNEDMHQNVEDYTRQFLAYSKARNTDLGIIYLIKQEENITIVNYLKEPVVITTNQKIASKERVTIQDNEVTLLYQNITYTFTFPLQQTMLKALMVSYE